MVHAHLISSEATTMTMLMRQTPNMWCRNSRLDRASTTSVHVHDHHQFMVSAVCTLHVREGKSRSQWKKAQAIINCLKKQRNTLNKHIISYIYGIDCYTFHRAVCRYLIMPAQCKSLTSFLFPHQQCCCSCYCAAAVCSAELSLPTISSAVTVKPSST